jgi:RNA-directed DNA polymerase
VLQTNSCIIENNIDEDWAILSLPKPIEDLPITVGKSINVNRDSKVSILGFPTYSKGDTYTVLESRVNSDRDSVKYLNIRMCTVDHPIIHGTSGGPVLDKNGKIIGVASAGTNSAEEESRRSGFIFIDSVISALDKHKSS